MNSHKFTSFLHLCSEMYFLMKQLFWSLWLLISVAAALCFHGCWLISLVADLLDSLILSRTENQKTNTFLSKISKTFAILTCINTNLRCIKDCGLLWIKQTDGPGLCFEDQYEALQISRNNCRLPGRPW